MGSSGDAAENRTWFPLIIVLNESQWRKTPQQMCKENVEIWSLKGGSSTLLVKGRQSGADKQAASYQKNKSKDN